MRISLLALAVLPLVTNDASAQLTNGVVDVNGVTRLYNYILPASYDGTEELPLMFVFHGGGMTASSMMFLIDIVPLADEHEFILIFPMGLPEGGVPGAPLIWNSEGPFSNGVDEIGFVSAMIDQLDTQLAIDTNRIYACGYSNGANLCWELACLLSDRIAAVAAVAGSMWEWTEDMCNPSRPVSVLSIHGTLDTYNPYGGNPPFSLGLLAASAHWAGENGTVPVPTIVNVPDTDPTDGSTVVHYTWDLGHDCTSVEHYRVEGGGHDWPGVSGNMDIDANELIWEFVSRYDLSGEIGCPECAVAVLGAGAGGANIATLDLDQDPSLGSFLTFDFSGFTPSSPGLFLLSLELLELQLFGGTFYPSILDPALFLPFFTNTGAGAVGFAIPNDPTLVGLRSYVQAGTFDPSQPGGYAFSNGLAFTICF